MDPVEYWFCGILNRYYAKEGFHDKISLENSTKMHPGCILRNIELGHGQAQSKEIHILDRRNK